MKWLFRSLSAIVLISLLVGTMLIVAAMAWGTPFDHAVVHIDDSSFTLGDLDDLGAGYWLLAFDGVVLACLVVVLVTPFVVLLPLAFAAVAVTIALVFSAAVVALVFSPLILLGWLVWRLTRGSRRPTPAATIAG